MTIIEKVKKRTIDALLIIALSYSSVPLASYTYDNITSVDRNVSETSSMIEEAYYFDDNHDNRIDRIKAYAGTWARSPWEIIMEYEPTQKGFADLMKRRNNHIEHKKPAKTEEEAENHSLENIAGKAESAALFPTRYSPPGTFASIVFVSEGKTLLCRIQSTVHDYIWYVWSKEQVTDAVALIQSRIENKKNNIIFTGFYAEKVFYVTSVKIDRYLIQSSKRMP